MKTALVTGASFGIGLELAKEAAKTHKKLVLVARSAAKLQALAAELQQAYGADVTVIAADLAAPGAAGALHAEVTAKGITVDTLVNNAGVGVYGAFLEADAKSVDQMLQLNMISLTELTRAFAADMVANGGGRILNVASTAAFQPGPLMATYYASKSYVLSFSEALANELAPAGVTVTALCPGPTRSGFQDAAKMEGSRILTMGMMDAATVAKLGWRGLERGRSVVITGFVNRVLVESLRLMPRCVVTRVSRFVSERQAA